MFGPHKNATVVSANSVLKFLVILRQVIRFAMSELMPSVTRISGKCDDVCFPSDASVYMVEITTSVN
jgi:hypothetical protein